MPEGGQPLSYYTNLQKAVDYVEQNLDGDIELTQAAKIAGYSIPHFYRVFYAIIGYSVMEYARRRRLSNAKYDLINTNQSITNIAFKNGFKSHEVFTRTFKSAYGVSPKDFRKISVELSLYEKINLLSRAREKNQVLLKPEIIRKEELQLLGIVNHINRAESIKYGLKLKTQAKFLSMADSIENRINSDIFYAVYDYVAENVFKEDEDINFNYYSCAEVSGYTTFPDGMVKKIIPASKYAVFNYNISNGTLNGENIDMPVYRYIDGVWLPSSGFEMSDNPDFEIVNKNENQVLYHISLN